MEFRNIVAFLSICKLRSFSKTAAELGYSQSAITMQIKQLEKELNVKLFDRIGKKIDITNEGKRFLKYADEIITVTTNAKADLRAVSTPNGVLRIGILESVCTSFLPQLLSTYHTYYPQVSTIIEIGTFDELSALLNSNSIDILWTFDENIETPDWTKAFSYNSVIDFVASPTHRLSSKSHLTLSDITQETFILTERNCSYRRLFEEHMLYSGFRLNIFLEIGNTDIIKKFVEANLGITLLPHFTLTEELADNKLAILHLTDYQFQMQGQLFYHKNKWLFSALKAFLELVMASEFS